MLVGTQMVAKGHHFSGVALAAVVDADTGLGHPDFRAEERTFQLLTQLAGRSGRDAPGRVLVQTFQPDAARDHLRRAPRRPGLPRRRARAPPGARLPAVPAPRPGRRHRPGRRRPGAAAHRAPRPARRPRPARPRAAAATARPPPRAAAREDRAPARDRLTGRRAARAPPRRRCGGRAWRRSSTSIRRRSDRGACDGRATRAQPASTSGAQFPSVSSAWVNSLGMIQILFEAPSAICGSTWRYWYARRVGSGLPSWIARNTVSIAFD